MKSAATTTLPNEVSNNDFVCGACLVVLLVVLGLTQLRLHPHAGLHRLLPTLLQQVYLRLRRVPLLRKLRLRTHHDDNDIMTLINQSRSNSDL